MTAIAEFQRHFSGYSPSGRLGIDGAGGQKLRRNATFNRLVAKQKNASRGLAPREVK
jgi:hypothetical protein